MITKTIGSGGDYATIAAALSAIAGVDLANDYTFDIISSVTETAYHSGLLQLMGHTVRLTSSYNAAHLDDWRNWYKINLGNGFDGPLMNCNYGTKTLNGTLQCDHFYMVDQRTSWPGLSWTAFWLAGGAWPATDRCYLRAYNGYIKGVSSKGGDYYGIMTSGSAYCVERYSNIQVWDFSIGQFANGAHSTSTYENITVRGNGSGKYGVQVRSACTFRNVLSTINGPSPHCFWTDVAGGSGITLENCACSDASITDHWTVHPDCLTGVSEVATYASTTDTDATFLQLNGCPAVGGAGKAPTYAGATDIVGRTRPNRLGTYAIGCHEEAIPMDPVQLAYLDALLDLFPPGGAFPKSIDISDGQFTPVAAQPGRTVLLQPTPPRQIVAPKLVPDANLADYYLGSLQALLPAGKAWGGQP